ncbi:sigma-70 family RNA polymerase sigma factor [Kitasatospora sp. LaBMicrA B282]|uniref:sigma-70 family RNA polymerase sigma factor n=1 Tax=Kitasatospora sp. LaBMicrA B282 TaxID=3420949 RepID=UPI003D13E7B8
MDEMNFLADRFEADRPHLRAVAYRILGSMSEAEDAVQEAWLRLSRSDTSEVTNLSGWLTTVVGRVCLDQLRTRKSRHERPLDDDGYERLPDPAVTPLDSDPEQQALLADSVGLALLVVLDTLAPAERLAFVLHDMFAVSFDEIAPIVDRTPAAARQLASRARRRVQGAAPATTADLSRQRRVADAWLAASRGGDFEELLELLDPDVVMRVDTGAVGGRWLVRGAQEVLSRARTFSHLAEFGHAVLVNGTIGLLTTPDGKPFSLTTFTIREDRIAQIEIITAPERLAELQLIELS